MPLDRALFFFSLLGCVVLGNWPGKTEPNEERTAPFLEQRVSFAFSSDHHDLDAANWSEVTRNCSTELRELVSLVSLVPPVDSETKKKNNITAYRFLGNRRSPKRSDSYSSSIFLAFVPFFFFICLTLCDSFWRVRVTNNTYGDLRFWIFFRFSASQATELGRVTELLLQQHINIFGGAQYKPDV